MSNRGISVVGAAMLGMILLLCRGLDLSWPWSIVAAACFASVTCTALVLARRQKRTRNPVPAMVAGAVVALIVPVAALMRGEELDSVHFVMLGTSLLGFVAAVIAWNDRRAKHLS